VSSRSSSDPNLRNRDRSSAADGEPPTRTGLDPGLKGLLDAVPGVLFVSDAEGRFLWTSPRLQRATDQSTDGLQGRSLSALCVEDAARIRRVLDAAPSEEESATTQLHLRVDEAASPVPIAFTGRVLDAAAGTTVLGIGQVESTWFSGQALQRERARLSTLYAEFPSPVVHYAVENETAVVQGVNTAFESTFGVEKEDLVGKELDPSIAPDDHVAQAESLTRQAVEEGSVQAAVTRETADGLRHFRLNSVLIPTDGVPEGFAIYTDVTEQKRREEMLRKEQATLRAMYRITASQETDFKKKIQKLIDLGREYLGLPYGFLTHILDGTQRIIQASGGHPLLQPGESCPLSNAYCRRTIEKGRLTALRNATEKGWEGEPAYETFELETYVGAPVFVEGELYGTFCFAASEARSDAFTRRERTFVELITRWVSYELEQRQAQEELERRNERLDNFASLVSHDLRNPLNVAKGRLQMALETGDGTVDEHLASVDRALDRMDELIEDVLALTRSRQPTDPDEWTECVLADLAEASWKHVDTARATLRIEAPLTLQADERRLQQLLENLFRNAVEHAGEDVTVRVGKKEGGFFVEDDGSGIPEEKRDQVLEAGYSSQEKGTGLGLSIVRSIADAHGWTLAVTEGREGGARFEITGMNRETSQ